MTKQLEWSVLQLVTRLPFSTPIIGRLFIEWRLFPGPPMAALTSLLLGLPLHWGAADAEIKVPSGENTELKRSPFII